MDSLKAGDPRSQVFGKPCIVPMIEQSGENAVASPLAIKAKISRVAAGVVAMIGMTIVPSYADVGVTSATDGDPLGRPPTLAERVLRVGINIQANEVISTKADDRAHILFLDGTSLTVASNAELVIDKYVYDPNAKTGEIAVSVSKGVLRLVGGRISKTVPMVVKTPSATIGIRGGIAVIAADARQTQASFLFGVAMTAAANGRTETATRPGSQIVTQLGAAPGAPSIIPVGGLTNQLAALEGRTAKTDRRPDEAAKASGFSSANSGQALIVVQPAPNLQAINKAAVQALSNAEVERQPLADAGGTLTFVNAAPQSPGPLPTILPVLPPTPPRVVVITPNVIPTVPSPIPAVAVTIPATAAGALPPIQRPATAPVAGVGNGSLAGPASPSGPTSKPGVTPTFAVVIPGSPSNPPTTRTTSTTPTTGPSTTPSTTNFKPTITLKPTATPTTLSIKPGATPAVGVGNGGLVHAVPPTNSRGGRNK